MTESHLFKLILAKQVDIRRLFLNIFKQKLK